MVNKIRISIPNPCGENWNKMTTTEKGKFCASCQKDVIDFTTYTDREILNYYNQNSKICGRFTHEQLNRNLLIPKEKNTFWMMAAASIITFLGLGNQNVKAQESAKTEQTDKKALTDSATQENGGKLEYSGIVYDDNNIPIPGLNITIKGTRKTTTTDINGKYSIKAKKRDILVFSYIGFKNIEYKISGKQNINFHMKQEEMMLGEVIIRKD